MESPQVKLGNGREQPTMDSMKTGGIVHWIVRQSEGPLQREKELQGPSSCYNNCRDCPFGIPL